MLPNQYFTALFSIAATLGQQRARATLRPRAADVVTFPLLAYGGAIGGLPVFYQDGECTCLDSLGDK